MKRYIKAAIRNPEEEPAGVRKQIAGNPNTREDVLLSLSADKLCWSELAENPSTPLYIVNYSPTSCRASCFNHHRVFKSND